MIPTQTAAEVKVPRILVVDDMPDNLFLMNGLLEDRYRIVQAASGKEALKVVMSDNPPDMVLLDIMMPDMDGYEVLRRIRQHAPTANIPVIFLTALASQQDERLGFDLGAVDYLAKPVDPELVVQRVEAHVRSTAHARRIEQLSEKLSRHLAPQTWRELFHGSDQQAIQFHQQQQSVLYAEPGAMGSLPEGDRDSFTAEVEWLASRHHGTVDRYVDGAAVVFFEQPAECVRMGMDLQRSASALQLRMGIHTGMCDIGSFCCDGHVSRTLIGQETGVVAKVAAAAAVGSISVSPETYVLVKEDVLATASGCLLIEEFHDSDLAQVCLTPTPARSDSNTCPLASLGV